jgi:FMN phosphatase YigB (HAD superfamily)
MPWISFDLDGTIMDWPMGRAVIGPLRERISDEVRLAIRNEYRTRFASDDPVRAFDWDEIHSTIATRYNLEPFPLILDLAETADWTPDLVYHDTRPTMHALRTAGWKIAVGTNGFTRYQRVPLERLNVPYDVLLGPDVAGTAKPHAGFLRALTHLSGDAHAMSGLVHVGDLLAQDVLAANRVGAMAVWVWRDMPDVWRGRAVQDRAAHPDMPGVVEHHVQVELERDGRAGGVLETPRPDLIVQDLHELTKALERVMVRM